MAIVTRINKTKQLVGKKYCRVNLGKLKRVAHRAYRRCAKQAIHQGNDINEKPRLTSWDII